MSDQFCLKWNNYQASLTNAFKSLLENEDFVDMTLSAGGKTLRAHKVVLSACSSYFKNLLKGISHWQHPVLVLRDVPFIDLYTILEFIYMGEVNISQADLQSFLKTAELLQIKGLTENVSWNPETDAEDGLTASEQDEGSIAPSEDRGETPDDLDMPDETVARPSPKRRRLSEVPEETPNAKLLNDSIATNTTSQLEEDMEVKEELDLDEESHLYVDESVNPEEGRDSEFLLTNDKQASTNKPSTKVAEIQGPSPNHKKCTECGIQMLKKNYARHMRDMHTPTPKPRSLCPLCQKSYKTSDWLKDHIRRGHGYSKELTDQVMASLESGSNSSNSESRMKSLSLEETKLPNLINLKEPNSSIAMIDIQSQPITILAGHTVVKEETKPTQKI